MARGSGGSNMLATLVLVQATSRRVRVAGVSRETISLDFAPRGESASRGALREQGTARQKQVGSHTDPYPRLEYSCLSDTRLLFLAQTRCTNAFALGKNFPTGRCQRCPT